MKAALLLMLTALLTATALCNGKKTPPMTVSFHVETTGLSSKELTFRQDTSLGPKDFEKVPLLQTTDFIAANPFASPDDKNSYGVIFQMKPVVANRFQHLSNLHRGKYLIAMVNGRVIDLIRINQTNPDDKICIWRNVNLHEVHALNAIVPKIGEEEKAWKARIKAENKSAKKR